MTRFSEEWYSERMAKQGTAAKVEKVKAAKPARYAKYKNRKVTVGNITFDSAKEARRYQELLTLQRAGKISNLELQAPFVLAPSVILNGRKKPAMRYLADFAYDQDGKHVVEDIKSEATRKLPVYRAKAHLMKHLFNIDITEI